MKLNKNLWAAGYAFSRTAIVGMIMTLGFMPLALSTENEAIIDSTIAFIITSCILMFIVFFAVNMMDGEDNK